MPMILHTINKSPHGTDILDECLRFCSDGDAILFIEDGIYAIQQHTKAYKVINQHPHINFFALKPDVEARGLDLSSLMITYVEDTGFVELTVQYQKVQSWF